MKEVRISKKYGVWFYEKEVSYDLNAPIYNLFDREGHFVNCFGCYGDMIIFCKTGEIIA